MIADDLTVPTSRQERLDGFLKKAQCRKVDVYTSAKVDRRDFARWEKDELADESAMSQRIEAVLAERTPLRHKSA